MLASSSPIPILVVLVLVVAQAPYHPKHHHHQIGGNGLDVREECTVTTPEGRRQIVSFYNDHYRRRRRHILRHVRRRRDGAVPPDDEDEPDSWAKDKDDDEEEEDDWDTNIEDEDEELDQDGEILGWISSSVHDNIDNMDMKKNVYLVEWADGTTNQVRFMVSNTMEDRHQNRRRQNTRCSLKPCPRPILQKSSHATTSMSYKNNNINMYSNNKNNSINNILPFGEYKVILPNGQDQYIMYPSSTTTTTTTSTATPPSSETDAGIQADIAAWSSKVFHMMMANPQQQGGIGRRHGHDRYLQQQEQQWDGWNEMSTGSYRLNRPDGNYHIVTYQIRMNHDPY